jgi:hypothetical protein
MQLTVNTSFWTRYRSDSQNPDLGDTLPQAVPGLAAAISRDSPQRRRPQPVRSSPGDRQHGRLPLRLDRARGTSLYASLAHRVTHSEVLRILLSIGGSEIMHFQTWQDKAGNAPPLTDPITGLTFPDLNADGELTQTNLIMPEPTIFLDRKFPIVSIIRPTETDGAGPASL